MQRLEREHGGSHGRFICLPFLLTDNGSSFLVKLPRAHIGEDSTDLCIRHRPPARLGLLERLHQTLRTEEVYRRLNDNPGHCRDCLAAFQERCNTVRPHWALTTLFGGAVPKDTVKPGLAQAPERLASLAGP